MSDFDRAVGVILKHEGGLGDHPSDPGGVTNYGVSLRFALAELQEDADRDGWLDGDFDHDGDVDADDIRRMTVHDAVRTYRQRWWDRHGYGLISDQDAATKVFDCSVNMGHPRAHRLAQQAVVACGTALEVDGELGPKSVRAINSIVSARKFVAALCEEQAGFYRSLVEKKPKMGVFLKGWLHRAKWPLG